MTKKQRDEAVLEELRALRLEVAALRAELMARQAYRPWAPVYPYIPTVWCGTGTSTTGITSTFADAPTTLTTSSTE